MLNFKKMKRSGIINFFIIAVAFLTLVAGCTNTFTDNKTSSTVLAPSSVTMYTFGDAAYDVQLKEGKTPTKLGRIASHQIPSNFPQKFLEEDGSYAGGRVFKTVPEAQAAVQEAKNKGIISPEGEWGVYELQGNWKDYVYEVRPNEYHLREQTSVVRRVY